MLNINIYFTMGLREKVALTIAVITFMQVISVVSTLDNKTLKRDSSRINQKRSPGTTTHSTMKDVYPRVQSAKYRVKKFTDNSNDAILNMFKFPDVEYPTASRPPRYYTQDMNMLQRSPASRLIENPSSITAQYSLSDSTKKMKYSKKKYNPSIFKPPTNHGTAKLFNEFSNIPKPNVYMEGGFPDVDYPLSAWETWTPNYWNQIPNYGLQTISNNEPKNPSPVNAKLKSKLNNKSSSPSRKNPVSSVAVPKTLSSKKSNDLYTTPAPAQEDINTSTTPFIYTPYTILYFDATPSVTKCDEDKDTTSTVKKTTIKKKKKKSKKKETSLTPAEHDTKKNDSTCHNIATLPEEAVHMTEMNLFTPMTDEPISKRYLSQVDTCPSISNQTSSHMYVATPAPHNDVDVTSASPFKIPSGDKIPTVSYDNKIASISDTINTVVSENIDNKDPCFEDNVSKRNKSSEFDVDEEFTTDVFPEFYENMLSVSTSTMSPMTIDEAWNNSAVLDPCKSVEYIDELDQFYIELS